VSRRALAELPSLLDPTDGAIETLPGLRLAAVLAILLRTHHEDGDDDAQLVLIERSSALPSHAGQLAFPGGKPEPHDPSLAATAIREAEEEVALPSGSIEILGRLGAVPTPTGFMIVPYVAWGPPQWRPVGSNGEVQAVLTPRLSTLLDPNIHRITGRGTWRGIHYEMHEFAIHQPPLWGATARMVWDLLERLRGNGPAL
jgi:8-oxo-dGTP pyrophosphatase MutT (NUDIX family)